MAFQDLAIDEGNRRVKYLVAWKFFAPAAFGSWIVLVRTWQREQARVHAERECLHAGSLMFLTRSRAQRSHLLEADRRYPGQERRGYMPDQKQ